MSAPAAGDAAVPRRLIRVPIDVRWRDLDAFNHVNNASFLTFLEEARLRWFETLPGPWIDESIAPLLAAANVNYRRPICWPARVAVDLWAERIGNSSLTIGHRIVDADDDAILYADGNTVLVWIDRGSGRSGALPASVRASLGG